MSVLEKLACSLGRRDEIPNRELARRLVEANDAAGIRELAANLANRDPAIRSDCIKTLYEAGYLKPELIAPHAIDFLKLLKSRENRLVWGGMLALSVIGYLAAGELFPHYPELFKAMEGGSVITRDGGVAALAGIASARPEYNAAIFPFLLEHLRTCRPKDVPQHSEKTLPAVNAGNKEVFIPVLEKRLEDLQGAQVKRVQKVIQQARKS
jgi:hypothetical protein